MEKYADLFNDRLGLLEGDVHLDVDPTVNFVQLPLRRLPVAVRGRVQAELQKLVDSDVIAPVTTPTHWVSALLVTTKQDGSLRICIDPKPLNCALLRMTFYNKKAHQLVGQCETRHHASHGDSITTRSISSKKDMNTRRLLAFR